MDSGKQSGFSPARKVYRPSLRQYLTFRVLTSLFPVVAFGLIILMIPIVAIPELKLSGLILGLVFIGPFEAFFVRYFLWRTHVRLVITNEGIGYSTGGFRIFTPWGNVAGFGRRLESFQSDDGPSWTREISGLELHQPAPVYKARLLVRLFLRLHGIERPSFFIPVSNVVKNWHDSEVAADIQRYAPQAAMKMPFSGRSRRN